MIQRIQTVYLALAFLCSIALMFIPIVSYREYKSNAIGESTIKISAIGKYKEKSHSDKELSELYNPNLISLCMLSLSLIINIFGFSNRKRQIRICWLSIIITFISLALSVNKIMPENTLYVTNWTVKPGAFIYSAILILILLARKGIAKDEALIRSSERLR